MELLVELGWQVLSGFGEPAGLGRSSRADVVLEAKLRHAVERLNPGIDSGSVDAAVGELTQDRSSIDPVRANRAVWELLRDGMVVQANNALASAEPRRVRYVDWNQPGHNEFLAVSPLMVTGERCTRRAGIVLFVNGIALGLLEVNTPGETGRGAYDSLRAYRSEIPQLFWFNTFVVLSNGSETKMGSAFAPWEHFAQWKKIDNEAEPGAVSMETMLRATCEPHRMLDIVENFVAYSDTGAASNAVGKRQGHLAKKVAKNHQYLGVNNAIEATRHAAEHQGQLGVFWHAQGAGKSLSMLWFTQKMLRKRPNNWTFVLVTDREELEWQLHEEFASCGAIASGQHTHAESLAHLGGLLDENHRYVFCLIHRFIPPDRGVGMPVLSERDDIIVIANEAHRARYDALAANMRAALPNASFIGFTGTPLVESEEQQTRRVFGDYVSTYGFADSIGDGATVRLYYENRIPELQLASEIFDTELENLLDDAAIDERQDKTVAHKFSRQYQLITKPERLGEIAADLVDHFANRGFLGKAMYVAIDKATAVRMYDLVSAEWATAIGRLESEIDELGSLERAPKQYQLRWMRETDMAVVVSSAHNEVADMAELGLDIAPHRRKMNDEDLDTRFKDPDDPFRLVFVCAMWLTGFDAPSTSTIYLDKPMRGHTLMQTIARVNRVFPAKDNGLIVDYTGAFRSLEQALAIYGIDRGGEAGALIEPTLNLGTALDAALAEAENYLEANDIDLADLEAAAGFEFVNLIDSTVEALLIDEATRKGWVQLASRVRKAYRSLMPAPSAIQATKTVSIIRNIANKMASRGEQADLCDTSDDVSDLLDRSAGTKDYIIQAAGEEQARLDLNRIDWEQLAVTFAANKRTGAKAIERELEQQIEQAVRKNPTVAYLADQLGQLTHAYNAGTFGSEQYLERLAHLHELLDEHQRRIVEEDLSEAELAIFDLLIKPAPELTEGEMRQVRTAAQRLLSFVEQTLVPDWKKKEETKGAVMVSIRNVLDDELPEAYGREIFDEKRQAIYEHIYASFGNDGHSAYDEVVVTAAPAPSGSLPQTEQDVTEADVKNADAERFARMIEELYGTRETWALPLERLMAGAETDLVEFKTSARWDTRGKVSKKAAAVITKTIAGFANAKGGTLLIGVSDKGAPVGLKSDYETFDGRQNVDKWLNWLTDIIINHLGRGILRRLRVRIHIVDGKEICRIDIPALSVPTWSAAAKGNPVLYERLPNSTRVVPAAQVEAFVAQRFGGADR